MLSRYQPKYVDLLIEHVGPNFRYQQIYQTDQDLQGDRPYYWKLAYAGIVDAPISSSCWFDHTVVNTSVVVPCWQDSTVLDSGSFGLSWLGSTGISAPCCPDSTGIYSP